MSPTALSSEASSGDVVGQILGFCESQPSQKVGEAAGGQETAKSPSRDRNKSRNTTAKEEARSARSGSKGASIARVPRSKVMTRSAIQRKLQVQGHAVTAVATAATTVRQLILSTLVKWFELWLVGLILRTWVAPRTCVESPWWHHETVHEWKSTGQRSLDSSTARSGRIYGQCFNTRQQWHGNQGV